MKHKKINLPEKFDLFQDYWNPRIIAQLNGQDIRLAKLKGELIWHSHEDEDELFYVIKGKLKMCLESKDEIIEEGEMLIIPRGTKHKPVAEEECWVILFEPSDTKHTGDSHCEQTKSKFEHI